MRNHRLRRSKASDIVTNGLVVHVDAANRSSYSGSGSTWFDLSGNNLNFKLTGSPTHSTNNGGYFTLNGSSQYANLPYNSKLNLTNWTVSVWVYLTSTPANLDAIISRAFIGTNNTINYYIDCRTQFQFGSYADPGGATRDINVKSTTTCASSVNVWKNVCGTFNGSTMTVYVNGVSEASAAKTWAGTVSTTSNLSIGCLFLGTTPSRYTDMRVSQAAVYSRALSSGEVSSNFNALRNRYGV
jgi:hypothetical protein